MEFIKLTPEISKEWDDVVYHSDDGWSFSLFYWLNMVTEVWNTRWPMEHISFAVRDSGQWVAVMPLHYIPAEKRLASSGWSTGGPVILKTVSKLERERIWKATLSHVDKLGQHLGAEKISISINPLTVSALQNLSGVNPVVEFGYKDVSTHTRIVDLQKSEEGLWYELSKDARQKIKKAQSLGYSVKVTPWEEMLDDYYQIHTETYERTGVMPHPKAYFEGIAKFSQHQLLWSGYDPLGEPVAFHNDACFGSGASYHTGCCKSEHLESGINYLLFWQALMGEKERGCHWYEVGEVFPDVRDGKLKGLTDFKSKFGGQIHRYYRGEKELISKINNETPDVRKTPSLKADMIEWLIASRHLSIRLMGARLTSLVQRFLLAFFRKARSGYHHLKALIGGVKRQWMHLRYSKIQFIKPYWSDDEFNIGFKKEDVNLENAVDALIDHFRQELQIEDDAIIVPVGSGRVAFELILRALKKKYPERNKVVVTTYGCRGVFDPIIRSGLKPVLVDINSDLLPDSNKMMEIFDEDVLACMTVDLCGEIMDLTPIVKAAKARGISVIEDCCQATGGNLYYPAHSRPDFRIYSFGLGKNLIAGAGGAVVAYSHLEEINNEKNNLQTEDVSPAYQRFNYFYQRFFRGKEICTDEVKDARTFPYDHYVGINPVDALILIQQIKKLREIIKKRQSNAGIVLREVIKYPDLFSIQSPEQHIYTKLSVKLRDKTVFYQFKQHMEDYGIELEGMYIPLHTRADINVPIEKTRMETVEQIAPLVINLPVRPNLSEAELQRITRAVALFGEKYR